MALATSLLNGGSSVGSTSHTLSGAYANYTLDITSGSYPSDTVQAKLDPSGTSTRASYLKLEYLGTPSAFSLADLTGHAVANSGQVNWTSIVDAATTAGGTVHSVSTAAAFNALTPASGDVVKLAAGTYGSTLQANGWTNVIIVSDQAYTSGGGDFGSRTTILTSGFQCNQSSDITFGGVKFSGIGHAGIQIYGSDDIRFSDFDMENCGTASNSNRVLNIREHTGSATPSTDIEIDHVNVTGSTSYSMAIDLATLDVAGTSPDARVCKRVHIHHCTFDTITSSQCIQYAQFPGHRGYNLASSIYRCKFTNIDDQGFQFKAGTCDGYENYFYNVGGSPCEIRGGENNSLRRNYAEDCYTGYLIYDSYAIVEGNVIVGLSGPSFRGTHAGIVVFGGVDPASNEWNASGGGDSAYAHHVIVAHNTIIGLATTASSVISGILINAVAADSDGSPPDPNSPRSCENVYVANNCIVSDGGYTVGSPTFAIWVKDDADAFNSPTGITVTNNSIYATGTCTTGETASTDPRTTEGIDWTDPNIQTGDPGFSHTFFPGSTSNVVTTGIAINKTSPWPAYNNESVSSLDFMRNRRVVGSAPDIGAVAYGPMLPTATDTAGNWLGSSGATIYEDVADPSAANDATYIQGSNAVILEFGYVRAHDASGLRLTVRALDVATEVPRHVFADDCNNTSGTAIGSHTPDTDYIGTGWAATGTVTIESNAIAFASSTAFCYANVGTEDQIIECDFTADINGTSGDNRVAIQARSDGDASSPNRYQFVIRTGDATSTRLLINKVVSGTDTTLANTSYSFDANTTYALKFQVTGTDLRAFIDGVEVLSATDSSITTGNYFGFRHYARANDGARFDNLNVYSYTLSEGSAVGTLQTISGSASGVTSTASVFGPGAGTLQAITGSATGETDIIGSASGALKKITGVASGVVSVYATAAGTLRAITGAASGRFSGNATGPVLGAPSPDDTITIIIDGAEVRAVADT